MHLFGTSGIRGLTGSFITEDLAYRVGNLFARIADESVIVAHDTRETAPSLFKALSKGITDAGKSVIDMGLAPTPTLAYASHLSKEPGIMITASHNPLEYNGFKIFRKGAEISREEEKEFEKQYDSFEPLIALKKGRILHDDSFHQKHIDSIIASVDASTIRGKKFKVVVDLNGAATVLTPRLLESLGCSVHLVHAQAKGFARPSEPNEKNLLYLRSILPTHNADIAFAHDGDGDRVVVLYPDGSMVPLDIQLALMSEYSLGNSKDKKVISTVESSLLLREIVEKNGGKLLITRVSSVEISHLIEKEQACFGGEPCGEYVYPQPIHCPDGPHALALFLEILATKGDLRALTKSYPVYPILREKFPCANEKKYGIVTQIATQISIPGIKTTIDGLRIDEKDGWFLIRASGTEPCVRLTLEYKTQKRLEERKEELEKLIQHFI